MIDEANDKKALIVRTAIRLFTEKGFHGTPTALVAREAGISNGTLFHYFPTKEELINFAYYDIKKRMAADTGAGVARARTNKEHARRIWRNAINWGVDHPAEYMFLQQFSSSPFIKKLPPDEIMKVVGIELEVFLDVIRHSHLKDIELEVAFNILFAPVDAVVRAIIDSHGGLDRERLIDSSFRLMWDGVSGE
ncbi:MAG TPA: TetR/AcrR family transcriptional regulator [Methanocella sp.]|nr:TetR/AcrR family transcriptional regulator [Methanocella sp.]